MIKTSFAGLLAGVLTVLFTSAKPVQPEDYTKYVNPFVGASEFGHCFPGACVPFGLIQVGPETGNCSWAYCSGYQSTDSTINGFSQDRLNGTGCPDLGDLLMLPFTGNPVRKNYNSKFEKGQEQASPGYYSVVLTDFGVKAEMTAAEHTAIHKYSFQGNKPSHLLIDFQSGMVFNDNVLREHVLDAKVTLESDKVISGFCRTSVWLDRTYYYLIEFSRPITGRRELPKQDAREKAPRMVFDFDLKPGKELLVKVALSSTGIENARKNLQAEIPEWEFDKVCREGRAKWNKLLSRIQVEGTREQKDIFYTSMYHLFIQPNNIADVGEGELLHDCKPCRSGHCGCLPERLQGI